MFHSSVSHVASRISVLVTTRWADALPGVQTKQLVSSILPPRQMGPVPDFNACPKRVLPAVQPSCTSNASRRQPRDESSLNLGTLPPINLRIAKSPSTKQQRNACRAGQGRIIRIVDSRCSHMGVTPAIRERVIGRLFVVLCGFVPRRVVGGVRSGVSYEDGLLGG
ncbi:hypothetical protein BDN70DRAFT_344042 [Pholiota conissans]|uniref:Uncharacterized protein n=1 Tax=Pholiota conissans TaxID=109636 RepID=A0A9P5YST7_9AGAR|nr:hypothetical protein BDN70DRAFT_344042 [Pholiota conissans]